MKTPKIKFKKAGNFLDDYPSDWPPKKFFSHETYITQILLKILEQTDNETDIHKFLNEHKPFLTLSMDLFHSGHHGAWVLSKQMIRTKLPDKKGLIPDFIVGGKNSDGFQWIVIELKGPNEQLFTEQKNIIKFSNEANKGLCQLAEYLDFCHEHQSVLREQFKLTDFGNPKGVLLLGREKETENSGRKRKLKKAWNNLILDSIKIRSYSWLERTAERVIKFHKSNR